MGSFSRTQSPVLTMSPSAVLQSPFGLPMFSHQPSPLSRPGSFGAPSAWSRAPAQPALTQKAGHKRSRDEAAINLDVEEAKLRTIEPVKEAEDQWIYGEGMVLIKSPSAYVPDAGTQSGTWVEEKAAIDAISRNEEARAINQQERPSLRSNKSQRLDMTAVSISFDHSQVDRSSPVRDNIDYANTTPGPPTEAGSQPIIDNFTLHLGIGWSRISDDEHIQAAARGWARYIENHFPVSNARILLDSKGLQSYLVEASEGYFLFAENLRQGQLVSRDLDQTFQNLKVSPPVFEGLEVMTAASTPLPTPDNSTSPATIAACVQDIEMNMA